MSCSPFDLRDYFLKELPDPQARQVEAHVRACVTCREELDRLGLAEAALLSLRDEEIPQRIAFVSDEVFEPSAPRRWWAAFWNSAPRLGFASAALLCIAAFGFVRGYRAPAVPAPAPVVQASITPAEAQSLIQAAVEKAVRESEARQEEKTGRILADFERQIGGARRSATQLALMEEQREWDRKHSNVSQLLSGRYGPPPANVGGIQ